MTVLFRALLMVVVLTVGLPGCGSEQPKTRASDADVAWALATLKDADAHQVSHPPAHVTGWPSVEASAGTMLQILQNFFATPVANGVFGIIYLALLGGSIALNKKNKAVAISLGLLLFFAAPIFVLWMGSFAIWLANSGVFKVIVVLFLLFVGYVIYQAIFGSHGGHGDHGHGHGDSHESGSGHGHGSGDHGHSSASHGSSGHDAGDSAHPAAHGGGTAPASAGHGH